MASASKSRSNPRPKRPAAVYLFQCTHRKGFKLGTALDPLNRARGLPEFRSGTLDLRYSLAIWFPSQSRATQVEQAMHKCLAPYSISPGHRDDGHSEWFHPSAFLPAIRLLQQMPQDINGAGALGLRPLAVGGATVIDRIYQSPQESWWFIEDLLLRLANQLRAIAYFDGESWNFTLADFRSAWEGEMQELRPRVMNTETFSWRLPTTTGNFVPLSVYEGDTLVLRFAPRSEMRSWLDGDAIARQVSALMQRFVPSFEGQGEVGHG